MVLSLRRLQQILIFSLVLPMTSYAGMSESVRENSNFSGFYFGGNIGYLQSSESSISTTPGTSFFNPDFFLNGEITRRSLVLAAQNNIPLRLKSFIGGLQIGYNKSIAERMVLGVLADIDLLSSSSKRNIANKTTTFLVGGLDYSSSVEIRKKLNELGTIRAKFGLQPTNNLLVYGSGGMAYGRATLDSKTNINNFGAPGTFPASTFHTTTKKNKIGWGVGGGVEYMAFETWSMFLEYFYYDLGKLNNSVPLTKLVRDINGAIVPYASSNVNVSSKFNGNTIRIGVNKHFYA